MLQVGKNDAGSTVSGTILFPWPLFCPTPVLVQAALKGHGGLYFFFKEKKENVWKKMGCRTYRELEGEMSMYDQDTSHTYVKFSRNK